MNRDKLPLRRRSLLQTLGAAVTLAVSGTAMIGAPASAQERYPTRAVKIVVPYAPGGNADVVTRIYAKELSDVLGQPFVVENKPGGATNIAAEYVARATPDGYTLYLLQGTSHGINPALYPKLSYDPIKDFDVLGLLASTTFYLVVNKDLPVKNVKDLVAYAKANPGKLSFASPGNASPTHLAGEQFNRLAGLGVQHVPYKGDAPAIADLMAGRVVYLFSASALSFVKQGQLKALAVADTQRWPLEPGIASMAEEGFPKFQFLSYFGLGAPAGTPVEVQERINRALNEITKRDEVQKRLATMGLVPLSGSRAEATKYVRDEIEKWRPIVKAVGAEAPK